MTIGSTLTDSSYVKSFVTQYLEVHPPGGYSVVLDNKTCNIERKVSKTWSGGDAVKAPKGPKTAYSYEVPYVTWQGRGKSRQLVQKYRLRTVYVNEKPKRTSGLAPHDYGVTYRRNLAGESLIDSKYYIGSTLWALGYANGYDSGTFTGRSPFLTQPNFDSNDQIALVNKLHEKIRGSDFNLAVFLAEGNEALEMIANTATTLSKAYSLIRKGRVVDASRVLFSGRNRRPPANLRDLRNASAANVSQRWLELQYGWLPLLQDMKSGAEMLSHTLYAPASKRYSVRTKKLGGIETTIPWNAGVRNLRTRQIVAYISEDDTSIPSLTGMMDPELVLWEKLPWSFVADWVLPIGDYLQARAFVSKIKGTFITTDVLTQIHTGFAGNWVDGDPVGTRSEHSGFCYDDYKYKSLTRTVSSGLDVPLPNIKPFAKVASWRHAANAVALLTQVARKG